MWRCYWSALTVLLEFVNGTFVALNWASENNLYFGGALGSSFAPGCPVYDSVQECFLPVLIGLLIASFSEDDSGYCSCPDHI